MQVTVPQFIDVESKIIGPISARQFIILVVTLFIEYLIFAFASTLALMIVGPILFGFAILLAFVRINGQMFHIFILNFLTALKRPRLRLWGRQIDRLAKPSGKTVAQNFVPKPTPNKSRLRELSLIVDTGGSYAVDAETEVSPSHDQRPHA